MICMVGQNPLIPGRLTSLLVQSWSLRPLQGVTVLRADRKQPEELKRAISAVAGYKTKSPKRWDVFSFFFVCVCAFLLCLVFAFAGVLFCNVFSHECEHLDSQHKLPVWGGACFFFPGEVVKDCLLG